MSLNEGQSQYLFSGRTLGPLNVLINEMAGTGKSISTISSTLPTCNIEAAVAVLELETLSRPAYLRALRKLHRQGIVRMEEILWRRARIVLCITTYLQTVSAKLPAGASVCGLHDEVGTCTAAD